MMSLRPVPARWFEVLVARDDSTLALESLAGTGAVELEVRASEAVPPAELAPLLEEYRRLAHTVAAYWAEHPLAPSVLPAPPQAALNRALERIHAWIAEAEPVIAGLQNRQGERARLLLWRSVFEHLRGSRLDFGRMLSAGPVLTVLMCILPEGIRLTMPESVLALRFALDRQEGLLVVGSADAVANVRREAVALKARCPEFPKWLRGGPEENIAYIAGRLVVVDEEIRAYESSLEELYRRHDLAEALGDISRLEWFVQNVGELSAGPLFAWVTGWTSDLDGSRLAAALERVRVRSLIHFPPPPEGVSSPLILHNPWWAKPFEIFARALGMPATHEADPSRLLAVIVPLLFGYMFGDVGQGLVLLSAGLFLQRRWPIARLLIPGGCSAAIFGLLFGSVFSRETILPALWLHPLEAPLAVLIVPLYGGSALLILGLILNGMESAWRERSREWWMTEAGFLLSYIGLIAAFRHPAGFKIALAGAFWFVGGHALLERNMRSALEAAGSFLEHGFQIAVNTLSFARVGAFALAHAGLSSAVGTLAGAASPAWGLVIVIAGNGVILILEALVVSIQTTRLVLFEFFVRFLRGEGRIFRPLPAPPTTLERRLA